MDRNRLPTCPSHRHQTAHIIGGRVAHLAVRERDHEPLGHQLGQATLLPPLLLFHLVAHREVNGLAVLDAKFPRFLGLLAVHEQVAEGSLRLDYFSGAGILEIGLVGELLAEVGVDDLVGWLEARQIPSDVGVHCELVVGHVYA